MKLHSNIMNIPAKPSNLMDEFSYKIGHRDARHAAAEIALKYENVIEDLAELLEHYLQFEINNNSRIRGYKLIEKVKDI